MLKGVFCPSITPLTEDGKIDYEAWQLHIEMLVQAHIHGILIFGSIGEFYAFTVEEKKEAIQRVSQMVAGRTKLFVGTGSTVFDETVELSDYASRYGVDAVVVVSPYYFGLSQEGGYQYFKTLSQTVSIPLILYNFPARTGSDLSPNLVARLAQECPRIVGIKDTVDTISHTRDVIQKVRAVRPDFAVLSGFDEYYAVNRIAGGNGVLSGLTNVEPHTFVAMHEAYESADFTQFVQCAQRISVLMALYAQTDLFISAIKGAVSLKEPMIKTHLKGQAMDLTSDQLLSIQAILATDASVFNPRS